MCSSPKLFAAYHVLHRLIVPRHPSCALSSLTTKKTFAPGTLSHSGLSLLLFLSTKKLFLFLQILFQDTFFDCQSTPRFPAALPLLPQRKSFLIKSVCRTGGFVGESFSPTPPFPLCAELSFPVGCALSVRSGGSAALLVRLRRPTPHHPLRGCAGGASLRCVHLRHFRSSLPLPQKVATLRPRASGLLGTLPKSFGYFSGTLLPPNRAVRSHPLRGAYRAFLPGDKAERTIINIWWAYLDLNQGPRPYQGRALTN